MEDIKTRIKVSRDDAPSWRDEGRMLYENWVDTKTLRIYCTQNNDRRVYATFTLIVCDFTDLDKRTCFITARDIEYNRYHKVSHIKSEISTILMNSAERAVTMKIKAISSTYNSRWVKLEEISVCQHFFD